MQDANKYTDGFPLHMLRKIITIMTKIGICRSNMDPAQEKSCFEFGKNTENIS